MKAFENKTNNGKELAVKKGQKLPDGAINLGWYSSNGVSPATHLSVIDTSGLIAENTVNSYAGESDSIMYADEFGVLRFTENDTLKAQYKHSPILANSEISVSNHILNQDISESMNYTNRTAVLGTKNFAHSYYVSTHFTVQANGVSMYSGMDTTSPIRNPDSMNIKVVDDLGNKYVDSTGKNNYEIYLERYASTANDPSMVAGFYRIIVKLPEANPSGISLVYDKFELTDFGLPKNQFLGYKERINAIPYYENVAEESEVIDFSSLDRRIYSTQLFSHKENAVLKNKTSQFGWKSFVPNKAVQDVRTFQSFNWRLVAKIVYSFSNVKNIYSDQDRPKVRCAVLTSGGQAARYPYIFANVEAYPFNTLDFQFENPLATTTNKSSRDYWTIGIENSGLLGANYDILYWTPTAPITAQQATAIIQLSNRNVSVFIDTSFLNANASSAGLSNLGINLNATTSTSLLTLRAEYINGNDSFNGWNMSDFNETSSVLRYGINGLRKSILDSATLPVRVFDTSSSYSTMQSMVLANAGSNSLVIKKSYDSQNHLEEPGVYFCSYNISSYLNDFYGTNGITGIENNQATSRINIANGQMNPIVEGPCKFFYNIVAESIRNKVVSSRSVSTDSSVAWHVSPWRNSWTINGKRTNGVVTVLTNEEKAAYNFSDKTESSTDALSQGAATKFVRQINTNNTSIIAEIFNRDFVEFSKNDASLIDRDYKNVDFYIECTNTNVGFLNFSDNTDEYIYGQNQNYKIYKLNAAAKNQIISGSPVSLNAYSKIESPEFDFSSIRYPYMIVDESEYNSEINDQIKIPKAYLPGLQQSKSYDFGLGIQYSYKKVTEINSNYSVNWEIPFSTRVGGSGSFTGMFPRTFKETTDTTIGIASMPDAPITINDSDSRFNGYKYSSKIYSRTDILASDIDETNNVQNNFHYTNDIPKSDRWDEYRLMYVTSTGTGRQATNNVTTNRSSNNRSSSSAAYVSTKYKKGKEINPQGTPGIVGYSSLKSRDYWSKSVFYENSQKTLIFGDLFTKWVQGFAYKQLPLNINGYISSAAETFLVAEFNKAYPNIYEVIEDKINIQYSPAAVNTEAITVAKPTTAAPTKGVGIKNDYVKYIQYTLNQNGFNLAVDGQYGPKTARAVHAYQTDNSLGFIDAIVDSQTKSTLAIYWLNLQRNNPARFQQLKDSAPDRDIADYIDRAVQYSDISNIGIPGREYRKISFTGVPGPDRIVDYIIVKAPDNVDELKGINFTSGAWNTIIRHVWVYDKDLVTSKHLLPDYKNSSINSVAHKAVNENVKANQTYTIPIANRKNIKYIMLKVEGDRVYGLGPNAEGFSIKNISFNVSTTQIVTKLVEETYTGTFSGAASGKIRGTVTIPSGEYVPINVKQALSNLTSTNYITEILLDSITVDTETVDNYEIAGGTIKVTQYSSSNPYYVKYSNGTINTATIDYDSGGVKFSLRPENSTVVAVSTAPTVTGATKLTTPPVAELASNFTITSPTGNNADGVFVLSAKVSQEFISEQFTNTIDIVDPYIRDAEDSSKQIRQTPKTVSALDGLVVLCQSNLAAIGFPNFASLKNVTQNTTTSFGFINLVWRATQQQPYGLRWEFYNIRTNKFYGKKISYYDYIKDGPNDIYVALLAYDNDGDSATKNIVGGDNYNIQVTPVPNKIIAPLYSVKVVPKNKISIQGPPSDLSKFDSWFVEISPGKFYKDIFVPEVEFTNFLKNRKNSTLRCLYDTTKIKTNISNIFGTGHYDIMDENPIIVSDNEIKVRHGSFHVYQNQIYKLGAHTKLTDANPVVPAVQIKIKDSVTKTWRLIDQEEILGYNKNTGSIIFKKEIVPSNPLYIEVSYTVKNSNIILRHINGEELPLNPFSAVSVAANKPIYVYIVPTYVEYMETGFYKQETNYSYSSPIMWTYDAGVFDQTKASYNPLALKIGTINVVNSYNFNNVKVQDLRVKGGGLSGIIDVSEEIKDNSNVISFADIFSGKGYVYPNGGYVIVRIPKEVKDYFTSEEDLYSIIRSNLTAGVSFDVQDMNGNDWRTV